MQAHIDQENDILTLRVAGDLLSTNAESYRSEVARRMEAGGSAGPDWKTFVVDLKAAHMVDSVGLNLIVTWIKWVRDRGGRMRVVCAGGNVLRTFKFTRLDRHVELVEG